MAQDCLQVTLLKSDLFGTVERLHSTEAGREAASVVGGDAGREVAGVKEQIRATAEEQQPLVRRNTTVARWWVRPLAIYLARREARTLEALGQRLPNLAGQRFPKLVQWQGGILLRTWVEGEAMQHAKPTTALYHQQLLRLMARIHFQGITHNDLAKEPNLLVLPDGRPGILDLQLGRVARRRSSWFRLLAREDLRHLLKHKRTYCPNALTEREKRILATPSLPARLWRQTGKRIYMFVTRRILKWSDREGAGDRGGR
jgi:hypothetical protein